MASTPPAPATITLAECLDAYQVIINEFGSGPKLRRGRISLLGWDLEYVCGAALANFIDQILVRQLNDFLPENDHPTILDCGANIGFTVLNYKRHFPQARVLAFEPDPQFLPALRGNLSRNNAGDVEVIDAAVWVADGEAPWFCEGIDGSHILAARTEKARNVTVKTVDLATYLAETIDLLKLDIEGAEYQVVEHLGAGLRNVKNLLIECHLDQATIPKFGQMLKTLAGEGFKLSMNSFGPWRDLLRQPRVLPNHWEQYFVVAGWREISPAVSAHETNLPYTGAAGEIALRTAHSDAEESRRALDVERSAMRTREHDLAILERQILEPLRLAQMTRTDTIECRLLEARFNRQGEHGWFFVLPELEGDADDDASPTRSALLLLEDEKPLGPAHSSHDDIRNRGGGRYSHWKNTLYFSTSDGLDPNTNGRTYGILFVSSIRHVLTTRREADFALREGALVGRESALERREMAVASREGAVASREGAMASHERALASREDAVAQREAGAQAAELARLSWAEVDAQRSQSVANRELSIGKREAAIADREAAVTEREASALAREMDATHRERAFANRDAALASREREVDALRTTYESAPWVRLTRWWNNRRSQGRS